MRSSGNIAKILQGRRSNEHSPPTRDGQVSASSESALSSSKDLLSRHQANISRLANAFGFASSLSASPKKAQEVSASKASNDNKDLDDLISVHETPKTKTATMEEKSAE